MPFISKKGLANKGLDSLTRIHWMHYRRWQHSKTPLVVAIHSDGKYLEGLNVKYLNPQTAKNIRSTLTRAKLDGRKTQVTRLRALKNSHPIAYNRSYRKYFLKYIVLLGTWEIPLDPEEVKKVNQVSKQRPEYHPRELGREVPKGLTKP